ncbi:hypothetical protein H5P28_11740 [Ruficoccus amylovorans]|uniref:Uncharacterized protein n=1 Tax=Ruficoccus amylovorans TaxID=1804625 RepID=A0A842HF87_9BACT|nr:hypothetical protein [Ruficoccus amylovorans]MBC2594929.1 hypothetical protein [Ruficoccus amylovorans]
MAGDWIKMRCDLARDPKAINMARYLSEQADFCGWIAGESRHENKRDASQTQRDARHIASLRAVTLLTIGGLLEVWSVLNKQVKEDGRVPCLKVDDIDEISGVPDFGKAMLHVQWILIGNDETIYLPNFNENNTPTAERRQPMTQAERARAYRERQKQKEGHEETPKKKRVTNVTSRHVDKIRGDKNITLPKDNVIGERDETQAVTAEKKPPQDSPNSPDKPPPGQPPDPADTEPQQTDLLEPPKPKPKANKGRANSLAEVEAYCATLGLPASDAVYLWHNWEGNDWTRGGKKIANWKSVVVAWKAAGHLPSQKNLTNSPPRQNNGQRPQQQGRNAGTLNTGKQYGNSSNSGDLLGRHDLSKICD